MIGTGPIQDASSPASIAFYPPLPSPESQADLQAWADIAHSMGEPPLRPEEIDAEMKKKIWDQVIAPLQKIRNQEGLPASIEVIMQGSPSLEYLQYLIQWKKARDLSIIWLRIRGHYNFNHFKLQELGFSNLPRLSSKASIPEMLEAANQMHVMASEVEQSKPLRNLDLSNQYISHLPPKPVALLSQLKEFNVGYNQLPSLPGEITTLRYLEALYVQHNSLTAFPRGFSQLLKLRVLEFRCNAFSSFPDEIYQLTQLTKLSLMFNRITFLPQAVTQLKQLKDLNLGCNPLGSFPVPVCELPELVLLDLGCTDLPSVPPKVSQLQNLVEFYLYYNKLRTLPNEITRLSRLELLKLEGNFLSSLPDALVAFTEKKR